MTYVISIVNSGTTAFNGITVTDNLGEYLFNTRELTPLTYIPGTVKYYANGILQATPAVTAGPPLTITGITVPAGGNVTLTYEAEVNSYAPLAAEASITNTATIAGAGVTPVTVNETVNAVSGPLLTITKSVSPVPVTENGTLTYTFLIQNLGNTAADAATGVVITDTFNPVLENLTVNLMELHGQREQTIRMIRLPDYLPELQEVLPYPQRLTPRIPLQERGGSIPASARW